MNRAIGPYAWAYWTMVTCNVLVPQLFWFKRCAGASLALFVISIFVNIGMWFERFVIIVTSLHRDFLPSSWGYFRPTIWDVACLVGSFGLFFTLFCLFVRFVPMVGDRRGEDGAARRPTRTTRSAAPARARRRAVPRRCRRARATGSLAEFATPAVLYRACESVRDAGYTRWDAHTPFPVHGLDRAMGLGARSCPGSCSCWRLGGAAGGFALQTWVHSFAYPTVISGKPLLRLAGLHPGHLRARGARRRARRGARHVRAQPAAAPPPPAVRVARLRARERRPLLHLDRGAGPALRPERDAASCCARPGAARLEWLAA